MNKQRVEISRSLRSTSPTIIWNLIGTPEGLGRWIADNVIGIGDELEFTWGNTWSHHEIRKAKILVREKNNRLQFRWLNEDDADAFVELRMEKDVLSNDYMLHIIDFAYPEDVEDLHSIWDDNMEKLHRSSGL